jgi:hypothetical protein
MNRRRFFVSASLSLALLGAGVHAWSNRWKYIVVHHSGGNYGSIEILNKVHGERQKSDPVDSVYQNTHLKKMRHASLALDKFWVGVSFTRRLTMV